MKKSQYFVLIMSPFILLIAAWTAVTAYGFIQPFFLPSPIQVVHAGISLFKEQHFMKDMIISLIRIIFGFTAAAALAIPIGIAMGLNKKAEILLEPMIDFIRYIPIPAVTPLFILWFGIGETEKIIVIACSVFFQLVLMVANSVKAVPEEMVEFSQTLGAGKKDLVLKVIVPYSQPRIFDDLRVAMGLAWSSLLLAEIIGATSGIGYVIIQSQRLLQTHNVLWVVVVVGILGLLTDFLFKSINTLMFPWIGKEEA